MTGSGYPSGRRIQCLMVTSLGSHQRALRRVEGSYRTARGRIRVRRIARGRAVVAPGRGWARTGRRGGASSEYDRPRRLLLPHRARRQVLSAATRDLSVRVRSRDTCRSLSAAGSHGATESVLAPSAPAACRSWQARTNTELVGEEEHASGRYASDPRIAQR